MLSYYSLEELESWQATANVRVQLSRFSAVRYVYTRIFQPYGSTRLVDAYHALIAWLAARGTDVRDVVFIGMSLDDPAVTPSENCRYDMGVAFRKHTAADDMLGQILRARGRAAANKLPGPAECEGFSIRDLESQQIAHIHCTGDLGNVDRAWHYLYRLWLPSVAFEPADLPAMEIFIRLPEEIGWTTFDLQACIPVVRL
jgi:DNA gyrase inhibitor GyrI